MTAIRNDSEIPPRAPSRPTVAPYTFQQLLDRQVEELGRDLVFHIHVPKASGGTVNVFFRQNGFTVLNFDMGSSDFFQDVSEDQFLQAYHAPPPRQLHLLTGHFRLDHPLLRRLAVPHLIVTTLRDPIDRMLSNYNYTLRMPDNPWHDDIVSKGMSFLDYAANVHSAFGPQYSFFDDTGKGTFAPTGTATPERCLNNLLTDVSIFGLTERFDEFSILLGYLLGQPRILAIPRGNVTSRLPNPTDLQPKTSLSPAEREAAADLLKDDIWFYQAAAKEYDRRVSDSRLQAVFSEVLPLVQTCGEAIARVIAMRDPANPTRRAFQRVR